MLMHPIFKVALLVGVGYAGYKIISEIVSEKPLLESKSKRRSKDIKHGFEREEGIARYLGRKGADVQVSPGSRGPYDVRATFDEQTWLIQSKASRLGSPRPPRWQERERLIHAAQKEGAEPIIALSENGRAKYYHAISGERVKP
jgi:Holliday junction resolvase